ncbi:response regulator [Chthonobacter albigriseus]|uniref:response regulator n=1 Tax=Chthonobacter albigriseus TaxID=1683161 RepID=UPI0015EF2F56|nr:response regulator [Chthonobacter albigriseus]
MGRIASHVPYLRRFARALSGSRHLGDAFVSETLKALIEGRASLEGSPDARAALFRAFFSTWRSLDIHDTIASAGDPGFGVDRRLQALGPLNRLVFLLSFMEGFNESEIAWITDRRRDDIRALIEAAERAIDHQLETRVLIIEDEWLIAADVKRVVEDMGHIVVGVASRRETAVAQAKILRPGLILSDIQLDDDMAGINAVEEILEAFSVPVVFVTGHSDRLLTGSGLEPTYVVGKPFDDATLRAVISQALFFEAATSAPVNVGEA